MYMGLGLRAYGLRVWGYDALNGKSNGKENGKLTGNWDFYNIRVLSLMAKEIGK